MFYLIFVLVFQCWRSKFILLISQNLDRILNYFVWRDHLSRCRDFIYIGLRKIIFWELRKLDANLQILIFFVLSIIHFTWLTYRLEPTKWNTTKCIMSTFSIIVPTSHTFTLLLCILMTLPALLFFRIFII